MCSHVATAGFYGGGVPYERDTPVHVGSDHPSMQNAIIRLNSAQMLHYSTFLGTPKILGTGQR